MIYLLDMPQCQFSMAKWGKVGSSCRLISQLTRPGSRPKNGLCRRFPVQLMPLGVDTGRKFMVAMHQIHPVDPPFDGRFWLGETSGCIR